MRFSQRHGYSPVRDVVQRESMDDDLRTGLWNVLDMLCWSDWERETIERNPELEIMATRLWHSHFKLPTDTIPSWGQQVATQVRAFFFSAQWYEVYDLLEFFVNNHPYGWPSQRGLVES